MKPIELRKPVRSDYANDIEWMDACIAEVRIYNRRMLQAIDSVPGITANDRIKNKLTSKQIEARDADTVHDYLQSHPALLQRYREIGIGCLLEF